MFSILSISVTSPCPESIIEDLGIKNWPIWTCELSSFDWTYDDKETDLLLEREVTATPEGEDTVKFGSGDLVVFPAVGGIFTKRFANIIDLAIRKYRFIRIC